MKRPAAALAAAAAMVHRRVEVGLTAVLLKPITVAIPVVATDERAGAGGATGGRVGKAAGRLAGTAVFHTILRILAATTCPVATDVRAVTRTTVGGFAVIADTVVTQTPAVLMA